MKGATGNRPLQRLGESDEEPGRTAALRERRAPRRPARVRSISGLIFIAMFCGLSATALPAGDETHRERLERIVDDCRFVETFVASVEKSLIEKPVVDGSGPKQVRAFMEAIDRPALREAIINRLEQIGPVQDLEWDLRKAAEDGGGTWREVAALKKFSESLEYEAGEFAWRSVPHDMWVAVHPGLARLSEDSRIANEHAARLNLYAIRETIFPGHRSNLVVDVNEDGNGEIPTFMEFMGIVGVRRGRAPIKIGRKEEFSVADFAEIGDPVDEPYLVPNKGELRDDGIFVLDGYCYRIYLPDTASPPGFVHEAMAATPGMLRGGSGTIGVQKSGYLYCVYAWPLVRGETGDRVFCVSSFATGILESRNEVAKWSGPERAPAGDSAFTGPSIESSPAVGVAGRDGDRWTAWGRWNLPRRK